MAIETADRREVVIPSAPQPAVEQQQGPPLACPRCTSTNTKFCYYNNYNFSQPRHFCKSCRRYWTQGGTLRDIPVGGASRKTPKRSRATTTSTPSVSVSCSVSATATHQQAPLFATLPMAISGGGFTSLLALGGFGLGLDDGGPYGGIGPRGVWAFPQHYDAGLYVSGGGGVKPENGGIVGLASGGGGGGFMIPPLPELAMSSTSSENGVNSQVS